MPNPSDPKDPAKKKANYNYSWPVPARKPRTDSKKNATSASNDKLSGKSHPRINRTAV